MNNQTELTPANPPYISAYNQMCRRCDGYGRINTYNIETKSMEWHTCSVCDGVGLVRIVKTLKIEPLKRKN